MEEQKEESNDLLKSGFVGLALDQIKRGVASLSLNIIR